MNTTLREMLYLAQQAAIDRQFAVLRDHELLVREDGGEGDDADRRMEQAGWDAGRRWACLDATGDQLARLARALPRLLHRPSGIFDHGGLTMSNVGELLLDRDAIAARYARLMPDRGSVRHEELEPDDFWWWVSHDHRPELDDVARYDIPDDDPFFVCGFVAGALSTWGPASETQSLGPRNRPDADCEHTG